jgi:hypothetical protein
LLLHRSARILHHADNQFDFVDAVTLAYPTVLESNSKAKGSFSKYGKFKRLCAG